MFHARTLKAPQLRKALDFLKQGERSTRELARAIKSYCPSTVISELNHNIRPMGMQVICRREGKLFYYRLEAI